MAKRRRLRVSTSLSLHVDTLKRLEDTCPDEHSVSSWADHLISSTLAERAREAAAKARADGAAEAGGELALGTTDPLGLEAETK